MRGVCTYKDKHLHSLYILQNMKDYNDNHANKYNYIFQDIFEYDCLDWHILLKKENMSLGA